MSDRIYYSRIEGERKRAILENLTCIFEGDKRLELAYIFGSFTRRSRVSYKKQDTAPLCAITGIRGITRFSTEA